MLSKEQCAVLYRDFVDSEEFVQLAQDIRGGHNFVCHHNAHLVAGFLQWRGHECYRVTGYYRCEPPAPSIRHSWVVLKCDGKPSVILEMDPRQLHQRGGYNNDLMPTGHLPSIAPIAAIVDPGLVELPDELVNSRWVVQSKELLSRYVQDPTLAPEDLDIDGLDALGLEVRPHYDEMMLRHCEVDSE